MVREINIPRHFDFHFLKYSDELVEWLLDGEPRPDWTRDPRTRGYFEFTVSLMELPDYYQYEINIVSEIDRVNKAQGSTLTDDQKLIEFNKIVSDSEPKDLRGHGYAHYLSKIEHSDGRKIYVGFINIENMIDGAAKWTRRFYLTLDEALKAERRACLGSAINKDGTPLSNEDIIKLWNDITKWLITRMLKDA